LTGLKQDASGLFFEGIRTNDKAVPAKEPRTKQAVFPDIQLHVVNFLDYSPVQQRMPRYGNGLKVTVQYQNS
jgi:hypothetical protein